MYFAPPLSGTVTGVPGSPGSTTLVHATVPMVPAARLSSRVQPVTPVGADTVRVRLLWLSTMSRRSPGVAAAGTVTVGLLLLPADAAEATYSMGLSIGPVSSTVTDWFSRSVTAWLSVTVSRTV